MEDKKKKVTGEIKLYVPQNTIQTKYDFEIGN